MLADLRTLGVEQGDILLVHSSFKSLKQPGLAPKDIIGVLSAAVGDLGTLLMPALSYNQSPHHQHDSCNTPSNIGVIPETFRQLATTERSLHPTHSVCGVGSAVAELFARHHEDRTPCGEHSPFRLLLDRPAKILMLGCGLRPNTTMHAIEELIEPPYLFGSFCDYEITDASGKTYRQRYRKHGFRHWKQRYDRIAELSVDGLFVVGQVLHAQSYLIHTMALKQAVLAKLQQDPVYFVDFVGAEQNNG